MGKLGKSILIILFLWIIVLITSLFLGTPSIGKHILILPLEGAITSNYGGTAGTTANYYVQQLETADKNPAVKAVILAINSPGGTVVASKEIADTLKTMHKPTIAWIREIGTSGAYWVATATNYTIADPLSITGSIGVISSYLTINELLEKYNVTYERLVTGKYKDLGSPFKELTPEERTLLEKKLADIHNYFVTDVANNRHLAKEDIEKLATGEFYLGTEALELGLIDELGGKTAAWQKAQELSNSDAELYIKEPPSNILQNLIGLQKTNALEKFGIKAE